MKDSEPRLWLARALAVTLGAVSGILFVPVPPAPADASAPRPVLRVMALGDSITVGVGTTDRSGYRIALQGAMKHAGARVDFVGSQRSGRCCDRDHEGHGGQTTSDLYSGLNRWLRDARPDIIFLHIGTNDVVRKYPPAAAARRLELIITRIRQLRPAAHLFVSPIIKTALSGAAARRADYNRRIAAIVHRAGGRTYLVPAMANVGIRSQMADAWHPNAAGYTAMARVWYQALRQEIIGAQNWPAR